MPNVKFNNDNWNYEEMDQYEEVYRNSLMMVEIIEENRRLKRENSKLKLEIKEHRDNLDKQYKYTTNQAANLLSTLINKSE